MLRQSPESYVYRLIYNNRTWASEFDHFSHRLIFKARSTIESVTPTREKENHTARQTAEPADQVPKKSPIGETAE